MCSTRRILLRRILSTLAGAAVFLWVLSYWCPFSVGLLPFGDTAIGIASKGGEFGIVQFGWDRTEGWVLASGYWHLLAILVLGFGGTYCGRTAGDATDVAGSFPVVNVQERNRTVEDSFS